MTKFDDNKNTYKERRDEIETQLSKKVERVPSTFVCYNVDVEVDWRISPLWIQLQ